MTGRTIGLGIGILAVTLVAGAAAVLVRARAPSETGTPTVRVAQGDLSTDIRLEGEVRAPRSVTLLAPPVGGALQLVRLAGSGTAVKAGDVVFEFDPSEQEYTLEQSRYDVLQAEQEITRMEADAAVLRAQDRVTLLQARFAVRRAELDARGSELVGAVEAKKNELALEEARRALAQLEEDVKSHAASSRASLAVLQERRNKARVAMELAQRNIDSLVVRSAMDGLVVVKENQDAAGGFFYSGMTLPEYRVGDLVSPGRTVAQVIDTSEIEIFGRVAENDRTNLAAGQRAEVTIAGLAGETFRCSLKHVGGLAGRRGFLDSTSSRQFDATFLLERSDGRLRPGLSAEVVVAGRALENVRYLPRQAVFEKNGKPVVYVRTAGGLEPREVKIAARTASHVVLEDLAAGTEVSLVNPDAPSRPVEPPPAPGGGSIRVVM